MSKPLAQAKAWVPPTAAVCAVLLASLYAFAKKSSSAQIIAEFEALSVQLSQMAGRACVGLLTTAEIKTLAEQKRDLEARLADCTRPARVGQELSQAISRTGAVVREIKPAIFKPPPGMKEEDMAPRYRVLVDGTYKQIADFLGVSAVQRLPTRVVDFVLMRNQVGEDNGDPMLRATITVESLKPEQNEKPAGAGADGGETSPDLRASAPLGAGGAT